MFFLRKNKQIGLPAIFLIAGLLSASGSFAGERNQHVFTYQTDRGVDAQIYLAEANDSLPDYYYCDLKTPICLENLCNPIEIRLEWDLLGNFRNYREVAGKEITKFDHEPFEEKDHVQLRKILSDKESLLQDYLMQDLVDTTVKVYSAEIDGLTAATSSTFTDRLVPGAIYTCYTLWYLVNGEIADRIRTNTEALLADRLRKKMLMSGITTYQDYILDRIRPDQGKLFAPDLIKLAGGRDRFIAVKSIRKLPGSQTIKSDVVAMIRRFDGYDFPIQNALIHYFIRQGCDADVAEEWVKKAGSIKEAQKADIYKLFEQSSGCMRTETAGKLIQFLESKKEKMDGTDRKLMVLLNRLAK